MNSVAHPYLFRISALLAFVLLTGGVLTAFPDPPAGEADQPPEGEFWADYQDPPETPRFRLSALVRTLDTTKAGIIDTDTGRSYFLAVGEEEDGVHLLEADYNRESAVIQSADEPHYLVLDYGDEIDMEEYDSRPAIFRGAGIEAFLEEHPEAEWKYVTEIDFSGLELLPESESEDDIVVDEDDLGEGIEAFLEMHPEYRERVREPAVERGEGIERFLQQPDQPVY